MAIQVNASQDDLKFQMNGLISNANYNTKHAQMLLFINNRLVHSTSVKKALDAIYSLYLPKNSHYFVYLSFSLAPENVDVNVHPTKKEVCERLFYQKEIKKKKIARRRRRVVFVCVVCMFYKKNVCLFLTHTRSPS